MRIFEGKKVSDGIVMGRIKVINREKNNLADTKNVNNKILHPEEEIASLMDGIKKLESELEEMYSIALLKAGESEAEIFEIHKMMLTDEDFIGEAIKLIKKENISSSAAIKKASEKLAEIFREMDSEYMAARGDDIIAVAERLCGVLSGNERNVVFRDSGEVIIAADELTPAETVSLDKTSVIGFVTERGSDVSHTAILARVMGIPAIASVGEVKREWDGALAILDGSKGILCIDPCEEYMEEFRKFEAEKEEKLKRLDKMRGVRVVNSDGEEIKIMANAGDLSDIDSAALNDAEGVGLFRSEFIFMSKNEPPSENEQYEIYRAAAQKLRGNELVVRTLDVGADKKIPYLDGEREENPALGIRAVRLCLKKPELLFTQFRALFRAAAEENISVMIPMISLPSEVERVLEISRDARQSLESEGKNIRNIKLGIMIETPSAAILSDILASMVDFFSIGTNDLIQYTLAADRENPALGYLRSPLPESVRRCIEMTCTAAKKAGIPVSVCGEVGADISETEFLLRCGVTKLSVPPSKILEVREKSAEAVKMPIG